ncbi:hypothetical protein R6Q59_026677 [Mikania micrantha]
MLSTETTRCRRKDMAVKRLHEEETETETVDRLSDLPESLQLRILSFLDVRHAIQTMMLSKAWVSSWTCVPILNFSSDGFKQPFHVFDDFVANALSCRQPVKLDRLTFKHGGTCSAKVLEKFSITRFHTVSKNWKQTSYPLRMTMRAGTGQYGHRIH